MVVDDSSQNKRIVNQKRKNLQIFSLYMNNLVLNFSEGRKFYNIGKERSRYKFCNKVCILIK